MGEKYNGKLMGAGVTASSYNRPVASLGFAGPRTDAALL